MFPINNVMYLEDIEFDCDCFLSHDLCGKRNEYVEFLHSNFYKNKIKQFKFEFL